MNDPRCVRPTSATRTSRNEYPLNSRRFPRSANGPRRILVLARHIDPLRPGRTAAKRGVVFLFSLPFVPMPLVLLVAGIACRCALALRATAHDTSRDSLRPPTRDRDGLRPSRAPSSVDARKPSAIPRFCRRGSLHRRSPALAREASAFHQLAATRATCGHDLRGVRSFEAMRASHIARARRPACAGDRTPSCDASGEPNAPPAG